MGILLEEGEGLVSAFGDGGGVAAACEQGGCNDVAQQRLHRLLRGFLLATSAGELHCADALWRTYRLFFFELDGLGQFGWISEGFWAKWGLVGGVFVDGLAGGLCGECGWWICPPLAENPNLRQILEIFHWKFWGWRFF